MSPHSPWAFIWHVFVGTDFGGAFWTDLSMRALLLGCWILLPLLSRGAGRFTAVRIGVGLYLWTRLAQDYPLWAPLTGACVVVACLVLTVRARRRGGASLLPWIASVLGVFALALALTRTAPQASSLLLCVLLAGFMFPPRLAEPGAGDFARDWLTPLWLGVLLWVVLDGISLAEYLPLLLLAILGWLGLGFQLWRRRAQRPKLRQGFFVAGTWSATVLVVLLALLEIFFRYVYDTSDANTDLKTCRRWWRRHVTLNSWNYRDAEFEPLDRFDDYLRIVVLGDSFGFGPGIDNPSDLIDAQIETALAQSAGDAARVVAFNLAHGGMTTAEETTIFRQDGLRLRPHAVVLIYMLNDVNDGTVFEAINHPWLTPFEPWTRPSYALDFLIWRIYLRWFMPAAGPYPRELEHWRNPDIAGPHKRNIATLIETVRSRGAVMVAVVYPFLGIPSDTGVQREALDQVLGVFEDHGVPAVDVGTVVDLTDPRNQVNPFDPHPNERVNRALAPVLARMVDEALSASTPDVTEVESTRHPQ